MEPDEPQTVRNEPIIPGEDLSLLSIEQLKAREGALEAEIERTRAVIESKKAGLAQADSLFRR